jgi:transcriptional regulator with XRE-family HTH domain
MPGVARIRPKRPIHVYLRQWREYYGLTQKQLGERLGVDSVTVGRWERMEAGVNLGVLQAIAEALSANLRYDDLTRLPPEAPPAAPPPPAPPAIAPARLRRRG